MLKTLTRAGIVVAMAAVLQVQPAAAYPRHHHHHYRHDSYAYDRHVRNCRTGGTVLGVAGGALVGNAITHHSTGGTIVGAAVGGLAGNRIAHNNCGRR